MTFAPTWEAGPDEADILPPGNADATTVLYGGDPLIGGQTIKFDDITGLDPALGSTFAARCSTLTGNWSAFIQFILGAAIQRPRLETVLRQNQLGAIVSAGSLSEGATINLSSGANEAFRWQFCEGAVQIRTPAGFQWIDSAGALTSSPASADKTLFLADSTKTLKLGWVTDTTYDMILGGSIINATPIPVRNPGPYDELLIGNLRLQSGSVWFGDTLYGPAPPAALLLAA